MRSASRIKRIYVFSYNGRYKIGVTNNIQRRLSQLSCGCPNIMLVYSSNFISNAFDLERSIHNQFLENCVGGEWFEFDNQDFIAEIDMLVAHRGIVCDYKKARQKENEAFKNRANILTSELYHVYLPEEESGEAGRTEEIKAENEQLEKFLKNIEGIDVPNMYSDLIYETILGENTESLVKRYAVGRYESFRRLMPKESLEAIDNLTRLIVGLINFGWKYEEIEKFVVEEL